MPSLRRPHRARMLAVRSYSDKHSLHKESRFSFPTISTKERKFKIGDHVIVPTKEKKMLTGIVRWTGGVMMSQEAKEVIAVGVETVSKMIYVFLSLILIMISLLVTNSFIIALCSLLYHITLKGKKLFLSYYSQLNNYK